MMAEAITSEAIKNVICVALATNSTEGVTPGFTSGPDATVSPQISPNAVAPNALPSSRASEDVLVTTPMSRGATALCAATVNTGMMAPTPTPTRVRPTATTTYGVSTPSRESTSIPMVAMTAPTIG